MSCHARIVEGLSEALASLRRTHEEGVSARHSPPRRACLERSRHVARPRHLAAAHQPHIRDRVMGGATHYSCFWTVNSTYRGVNFTTESAAGRLIIDSSMRTRWRPSTPPGRRMTTRSASGSSKLKS